MKVEDIRKLDAAAIQKEVGDLEVKIMRARLSNRIGTSESPVAVRQLRRTVAKLKTILREKELQG